MHWQLCASRKQRAQLWKRVYSGSERSKALNGDLLTTSERITAFTSTTTPTILELEAVIAAVRLHHGREITGIFSRICLRNRDNLVEFGRALAQLDRVFVAIYPAREAPIGNRFTSPV